MWDHCAIVGDDLQAGCAADALAFPHGKRKSLEEDEPRLVDLVRDLPGKPSKEKVRLRSRSSNDGRFENVLDDLVPFARMRDLVAAAEKRQ